MPAHPLIGILSDSHGRAAITGRAVAALKERGCSIVIHLGDIETETVIDELVGAAPQVHLVFGNCDLEEDELARYAGSMDLHVDHPLGRVTVGGKEIAFTHGHLDRLMEEAIQSGVHYLLHGHTHEVRNERVGPTRIINPGALFRARRYTAAVLNPSNDTVEFIDV